MKTEKQKMLAGEMYDPLDKELSDDRTRCRNLFFEFNQIKEEDKPKRLKVLAQLVPEAGKNLWIEPPFYCDYGYNIKAGNNVFMNFDCVILDVMAVEIGDQTMFGPGVHIYTATHPLNAEERLSGREYAKPVKIGKKVWVGGGAIICPGVTIGDRAVIGAGSVVTKDIPNDVFAAGNPCKVIREIDNS